MYVRRAVFLAVSVLCSVLGYRDEKTVAHRLLSPTLCRDVGPSNIAEVGLLGDAGYTTYPEECAPDGTVHADSERLPSVEETSYDVICYTAEKAGLLGVDMQGYELGSKSSKELAERIHAKFGDGPQPECMPKGASAKALKAKKTPNKSRPEEAVFDMFDTNEDGSLDVPEMVMFAHQMAMKAQKRMIQAFPFDFQFFVRKAMYKEIESPSGNKDDKLTLDRAKFAVLLRRLLDGEMKFFIDTGDERNQGESTPSVNWERSIAKKEDERSTLPAQTKGGDRPSAEKGESKPSSVKGERSTAKKEDQRSTGRLSAEKTVKAVSTSASDPTSATVNVVGATDATVNIHVDVKVTVA